MSRPHLIERLDAGLGLGRKLTLTSAPAGYGTTMLLDAGELDPTSPRTNGPRNAQARPNSTRPPYEWIARYIQQMSSHSTLDYALITHFHDDHFGASHKLAPLAPGGAYRLTGLTGVGERIPIRTLFDRGYPDYDYPVSLEGKEVQNMIQQNPHMAPALNKFSRTLHNWGCPCSRSIALNPAGKMWLMLNSKLMQDA